MKFLSFMIMVAYILVSSLRISIANDSMNVLQSMSDGVSLVSKGGKFEFGFFVQVIEAVPESNKH